MTAPGGSNRQVKIIISADVAQAIRSLGQVETGLGGVGQGAETAQKKTSTMGDVMKGTLAASGIQMGLSGIVSGFKSVVDGGLGYERSMNTMAAVTQASDAQMSQIADTAKQLGADIKIPGASAQSAAAAMTELAKGGLTADQSMQAARGTMILAAAAQIDGAQAAEIQANALNTFGLKADQAGRVANVLANVANQSSGEIGDFAQGLAQAGTVASSFGWTIEDTTTYLGLMANAGIKGSDAGTALKTAMSALLNPSKSAAAALDELGIVTTNANGQMISARELTQQLAAAKARMSDADFNAAAAAAFGTDAVRTALVAAQAGTAGYDDMAAALGNVNGAQDVAAANSKGLSGVIDALKNTVDTASLSLFEQLQPSIMEVATAATGLVTPLADALTPALGAVAGVATNTLAPALTGVTGVLGAVIDPLSGLIGWFSDLPTPIGTAVLALGGVIAIGGPLNATFTSAKANLVTLLATMRGTAGAATAASGGLAGYIASIRAATGAAATFGAVAKGALSVLGGPIGLAIIGVTTALSLFSSGSDEAATSTEGLSSAIDEQTGKLKGNAAQVIATEAANSGASAAYERLGGNVSDYVDALGGVPGAQEKVNAKIAEGRAAYEAQLKATQDAARGAAGFTGAQAAAGAAAGQAVPSIQDLNSATDYLSSAQGTLAGKTDDVRLANAGAAGELAKTGAAVATTGDQMAAAEEKTTPFGDALKEIRSAASEADAAAQFLSITLLQMSGNTVPAGQRARANAAAFREVGQATRDIGDANDSVAEKQAKFDQLASHLGTTLDGQAESATNAAVTQADLDAAGRDLADAQANVQNATDKQKDALDKAAQSARDMTAEAYNNSVGQVGLQGAINNAVGTMQVQREQFIKSATDAGISQQAAEDLANAQGLIPENVRTTYETIGAEDATKKAKELNDALDKINDRTVHYSVVGGEVTTVGTMRGTSGGLAAYATGGIIPGPVSRTDNTVIAARTGEAVMVPQFADAVGGAAGVHRLNRMAEAGMLQGFARGGVVGASLVGDYKAKDWTESLASQIAQMNQVIKDSMGSFSGGLNSSQNPASFGWTRGQGIVPYSWNGHPFVGGVAGGTQGLWAGLMNALVPQIPGGLMAPIWAYENRNNVNSPGNASFHAYGLAADINAPQNPNGAPGDGRSGPGVIPAGVARSLAARFGMEWGGDFRGTPDPMHFEIHVSPGQIGAGGTINLGAGAGAAAGGAERWRSTVLQALSITGQSPTWASAVLKQMNSESSGNPRAINTWDRNFPLYGGSKGLMQVIDPTFRRYALPGYDSDIYDPLSNIIASIRYVMATYPEGIARFNKAQAYAKGGIVPGLPSQGDSVPALLTPGEGVFTAAQTDAIITHAQALASGFGAQPVVNVTPHIEITNYVDIDGILSRTEVIVDGKFAEAAAQVRTVAARS